jgi:hypothetical protein
MAWKILFILVYRFQRCNQMIQKLPRRLVTLGISVFNGKYCESRNTTFYINTVCDIPVYTDGVRENEGILTCRNKILGRDIRDSILIGCAKGVLQKSQDKNGYSSKREEFHRSVFLVSCAAPCFNVNKQAKTTHVLYFYH